MATGTMSASSGIGRGGGGAVGARMEAGSATSPGAAGRAGVAGTAAPCDGAELPVRARSPPGPCDRAAAAVASRFACEIAQ